MTQAKPFDDRIMHRLKLRELRVFMAVAQSGSMGKAAVALSISQPAVSKAIADMEHTLGVRLLDRTALGVEPTLYGDALIKWARAVFDDLRQGVREIAVLSDSASGEVRIGSIEPMTAGVVPVVIDRLTRQFPRIAFTVVQAATPALQYRDLRERRIDLVLGRIVTPTDDDLDAEKLFEDPLRIVAGTSSKWLRRRKIEPVELLGEMWCGPPYEGSFVGPLLAQAFRARGLDPPEYTVKSNSIQLFSALLATGRFLAVLSESTLQLSGARLGLKALPVRLPVFGGPVGIVTLKNRTVSPVSQLFIDRTREVARTLA